MRIGHYVIIGVVSCLMVWGQAALLAAWGTMDVFAARGGASVARPAQAPASWPDGPWSQDIASSLAIEMRWWEAHEEVAESYYPTLYRWVEVRVGWPVRTFAYERSLKMPEARGTIGWQMDDPVSAWRGGADVPRWLRPAGSVSIELCVRRTPVRPLIGGFGAMVLVHAGALVGLTWVVRRWRAWRLWRTGRCPGCGYSRNGLARCPECGRELEGGRSARSVGCGPTPSGFLSSRPGEYRRRGTESRVCDEAAE